MLQMLFSLSVYHYYVERFIIWSQRVPVMSARIRRHQPPRSKAPGPCFYSVSLFFLPVSYWSICLSPPATLHWPSTNVGLSTDTTCTTVGRLYNISYVHMKMNRENG